MDFLDPIARKRRKRQLFLGYGLVTILVGLATYILAATAVGYEVFNTNGDVVQNGLVFVDSEPVSADITVNGKPEDDRTEAKLPLAGGEYNIVLSEEGYRQWSKKIIVEGGKVKFVTYPILVPDILKTEKIADLSDQVGFATQSPNLRWLVVQHNDTLPAIQIYDLEQDTPVSISAVLPSTITTNVSGNYGSFEVIEWADDSQHFLLKQSLTDGTTNFLLINRDNVDASINLENTFAVEPTNINLVNSKANRFYMYFAASGLLRIADLDSGVIAEPIIDQVLNYKAHGNNLILYATTRDAQAGKVAVKIYDEGTSYLLTEVAFDLTNTYYLDFANFEGSWYYAVSTSQIDRLLIYRNPLNFIAAKVPKKAALLTTLKMSNPTGLSFSLKTPRFILIQNGRSAAVYDAEEGTSYAFDPVNGADTITKLVWINNTHLQAVFNGKVHLMEFDGQNSQELVDASGLNPGFFSKDIKTVFSISPETQGESLKATSLVAPKTN